MLKVVLAVLFFAGCLFAQDLASDQAAVQAILDANAQTGISVSAISTVEGDRITKLKLYGGGPLKNLAAPLTTIPAQIGDLSALKTLEISQNSITSLPAQIGDLATLTGLTITWNKQLAVLPDEIGQLTALTQLSLFNNALTALPSAIGALTAVEVLRVENNALTVLPDAIGSLSALRQLYAFSNVLSTLPATMVNLSALTTLSIGNNRLCNVTDQTLLAWLNSTFSTWSTGQYCAPQSDIEAVEAILAANEITNLTVQGITSTANNRISELLLANKGLTVLPADIGVLSGLTTLGLANNQLTALPDEVGQLTALKNCSLTKNKLTTLPQALFTLPNLTRLDVDSNMLCGLTEDQNTILDSLDNTTGYTWRETQVCTIKESDSIAVQAFLNACGKFELTPSMVAYTTLDRVNGLWLWKKNVAQLVVPVEVAALTELRVVALHDNAITSVPPEIERFTMITGLILDRNPITQPLPATLGNMTNLVSLGFQELNLTELPAEIMNLTGLKSISLTKNPLCELDQPMQDFLTSVDSAWRSSVECGGAVRFGAPARPGTAALSVVSAAHGVAFILDLPKAAAVTLDIYNLAGKRVQHLKNDSFSAGTHVVAWESSKLAAGTYQISARIGGSRLSRIFVLER